MVCETLRRIFSYESGGVESRLTKQILPDRCQNIVFWPKQGLTSIGLNSFFSLDSARWAINGYQKVIF